MVIPVFPGIAAGTGKTAVAFHRIDAAGEQLRRAGIFASAAALRLQARGHRVHGRLAQLLEALPRQGRRVLILQEGNH